MFRFIGTMYLLFAFYLFDAKSPSGNVGWSIFYFASIFFSLAMMNMDVLMSGSKLSKSFYALALLLLLGRGIYEISLCGLDYTAYMLSANSEISKYVFGGVTLFMFIGLCLKHHKNGKF